MPQASAPSISSSSSHACNSIVASLRTLPGFFRCSHPILMTGTHWIACLSCCSAGPLVRGCSSSSVHGDSSSHPWKLTQIILSGHPYVRGRHCASPSVQLARIFVARVARVTTEITPCCGNSSIIISPWGDLRNQTHDTLVWLSVHTYRCQVPLLSPKTRHRPFGPLSPPRKVASET